MEKSLFLAVGIKEGFPLRRKSKYTVYMKVNVKPTVQNYLTRMIILRPLNVETSPIFHCSITWLNIGCAAHIVHSC